MYFAAMRNVFKNVIAATIKQSDSVESIVKLKEDLWKLGIEPKLRHVENFLCRDNWFLGYLSVIDFDIY